jgi:asparagine synthase (glutamine-hydrolysing)
MRDPFGQRPLHYSRLSSGTAFASMPSALLALRSVSQAVLPMDVAAQLAGRRQFGPQTIFAGIKRVLPGHVVVVEAEQETQHRYWNPTTVPLQPSQDGYTQAYRFELDRAVESAMRQTTGSVAAQLSSGYDSSAVASTAARLHGPGLLALTSAPKIGFAGPLLRGRLGDESALAALTAGMHGMRHHIVRGSGELVYTLRRNAALYQCPAHSVVNMEWWGAIAQAAKGDGAAVLLTGELGNLTLNAGGVGVLADWLRDRGVSEWFRQARAVRAQGGIRWRGIAYGTAWPWLPSWADQALGRAFLGEADQVRSSFVRHEWLSRIGERDNGRVEDRPSRRWMLMHQDFGVSRKGALADYGLDERDPTADRRLAEFSLRLPPEALFADGVNRPLARRALADRVPAAVLDSKLRGIQASDWAERLPLTQLHELLDEIASSAGACDLLDVPAMRKALDSFPKAGSADHGTQMLFRNWLPAALSTGLFMQWTETFSGRPQG